MFKCLLRFLYSIEAVWKDSEGCKTSACCSWLCSTHGILVRQNLKMLEPIDGNTARTCSPGMKPYRSPGPAGCAGTLSPESRSPQECLSIEAGPPCPRSIPSELPRRSGHAAATCRLGWLSSAQLQLRAN